MNQEDLPEHWTDHAGDTPDADVDWTWDMTSLECGEYVGFRLYQQVRDRMQLTHVPDHACNRVMMHMIDMHDQQLVNNGVGCATLVTRTPVHDTGISFVKILEPEFVKPLTEVTNWKDMLQDKLTMKDFDHLFDDTDDPDEPQQPDDELPD